MWLAGVAVWPALFGGRASVVGDYLVLLSAPNWAVFSVLSRRGLRAHPAARMMFYVMTSGWLLSIPLLAGGPGLGEIARLTEDPRHTINKSLVARHALLTELKRKSPHVNGDVAVSGVTVTARDRRW